MFIYYGLMPLLVINSTITQAAYFILSINTGAYMAETVRGGILSIDPGQTEGAKSIGMTHVQTMIYVILPQALRNLMPQIGNNLIINIKDSCVLSVIGVAELLYKTKAAAGALYMNFETYTTVSYTHLYDVMMAKKICDELGYDLQIVRLDWDSLIPAVSTGQVDCVIAGQSITTERLQAVDFTEPYYYATIVTLVKNGSKYARCV